MLDVRECAGGGEERKKETRLEARRKWSPLRHGEAIHQELFSPALREFERSFADYPRQKFSHLSSSYFLSPPPLPAKFTPESDAGRGAAGLSKLAFDLAPPSPLRRLSPLQRQRSPLTLP